MLAVLDTYMSVHGFNWPAEVSAAGNSSDRHAAIRAYLDAEAAKLSILCIDDNDPDSFMAMSKARASLMHTRTLTEDVCFLAALVFDVSVNVIQHLPGDMALQVMRYGGMICCCRVFVIYTGIPQVCTCAGIHCAKDDVLMNMNACADQEREVWMYVRDNVYEAVFPQQVMALVPCVNGEQSADMQNYLLLPNGEPSCSACSHNDFWTMLLFGIVSGTPQAVRTVLQNSPFLLLV